MKSVIKKQSRQEGMMKERGIGHKFLQRGIKSYGKATSASSSLKWLKVIFEDNGDDANNKVEADDGG